MAPRHRRTLTPSNDLNSHDNTGLFCVPGSMAITKWRGCKQKCKHAWQVGIARFADGLDAGFIGRLLAGAR